MGAGVSNEKYDKLDQIKKDVEKVFNELMEQAKLEKEDILVVGCSTSEVANHGIGTFSSEEIGQVLFETLNGLCKKQGIYLATQCCEHLNRAIIIEKAAAKKYGFEMVNVVPMLKAGGAFSTAAYKGFDEAVAIEAVKAHAGIDIGNTLIGMHLKAVAVPVRTSVERIGGAYVVCARTRLKYIGGVRANYME